MVEKLFDIIVPTFNRYKELPEFFEKNSALGTSNAELWIVDDCSPMPDIKAIPSWKNIHYIRLEKNQGQAFARNIAIEKSINPYVISLDDDAWFEDAIPSLTQLDELFRQYPDAGCIMFNIATPHTPYSSVVTGTRLPLHVTCGCAYRRVALEQIDGFSGFLHSQAEESDISIRLLQKGWNIYFAREIKVFHNFIPGNRSLSWYYKSRHNTIRNDLLIVLMYYPGLLILPFLAGKYLSHIRYIIRNGVSVGPSLFYVIKAGLNFIRLSPKALKKRKPLTFKRFNEWRGLIIANVSRKN